jgi:plastocyanin
MKIIIKNSRKWFARIAIVAAVGYSVALATNPSAFANEPTVTIKMLDMPPSFLPSKVTIKTGDTVKWENVGNSMHHATDDKSIVIKTDDVAAPTNEPIFDSGFMRPGESFSHTFTAPGVYRYVCVAHETSGMIGEIIVER